MPDHRAPECERADAGDKLYRIRGVSQPLFSMQHSQHVRGRRQRQLEPFDTLSEENTNRLRAGPYRHQGAARADSQPS
jgi:hypothetical protein